MNSHFWISTRNYWLVNRNSQLVFYHITTHANPNCELISNAKPKTKEASFTSQMSDSTITFKRAWGKTSTFTLKYVSAIFYQTFIFSPNENYGKCFLFHLKSSFRSCVIQIFVIFPSFLQWNDKSKWNNLWSHELTCINLQMYFLE